MYMYIYSLRVKEVKKNKKVRIYSLQLTLQLQNKSIDTQSRSCKMKFFRIVSILLVCLFMYFKTNLLQSGTDQAPSFCHHNPILRQYTLKDKQEIDGFSRSIRENRFQLSEDLIEKGAIYHDRLQIFQPIPRNLACPVSFERYGSKGVGEAKFLCGVNYSNSRHQKCLVMSLGSDGDFTFEEALVQSTDCWVRTFDCTGAERGMDFQSMKPRTERIKFYDLCIAKLNYEKDKKRFVTASELLNGAPERVSLLKMDIEGYEFEVISELLLQTATERLPLQIAVEVHYGSQMPELWWSYRADLIRYDKKKREEIMKHGGKSAAQLALFQNMLEDYGYRLIMKEDNPQAGLATELVFMRFYC